MRKATLAIEIMRQLPVARGRRVIPADQLALILLLQDKGALAVYEIREHFGFIKQATVSETIKRAELAGRVFRVRRGRENLAVLTSAAERELATNRSRDEQSPATPAPAAD